MAKDRTKRFLKNADGAVAATYALALVPLIAVAGLAFDYARMAGLDTELQNAADQAALAGATQLDRRAGSMERAIAAIQGGLVTNRTLFANDGDDLDVDLPTTNIVFFSSRADAEAGINSFTDVSRFAEAGFVSVTVETRSANYALTPIVGALRGDVFSSAVAGLGSALCRIPPLMVCNPDEDRDLPNGEPGATFDNVTPGSGILVVAGQSGGGAGFWEPGNYGFLDLGNGAAAVAEGLGWLGPGGGCTSIDGADTISPDEEIDTEPGLNGGAIDSINTRFDIYQNNSTCPSDNGTEGDVCPSALNTRKDLVQSSSSLPINNKNSCKVSDPQSTGWHEPNNPYDPGSNRLLDFDSATPDAIPDSMGHPRDTCHAWDNIGDCADGRFGDGLWDRNAYFRTHYTRGDTSRWLEADWKANLQSAANMEPIAPSDINSVTRYQVYQWEIANAGRVIDGVEILAPHNVPTNKENHSTAICSQFSGYGDGVEDPDRRVFTIAVINCKAEGIKGKSKDVQIADWIDVFLVQPSADRDHTDKFDMYFEFIRKTDLTVTGVNNAALIRRDVPYLVQ
ncbi:hypothetical protein BPTFM16_01313 [Altererythrobacter insulae]|nr:hypothetical protein BPTFM16_01313 [Altererythrobacter insulae]